MTTDWIRFLAAILLLLPPAAIIQGSRTRHRALSHDWKGFWGRTLLYGVHAVDFGRALLGAWCLTGAFATAPDAVGLARHAGILTQAGVLALATVLQVFICREPGSANAPFAFVGGVTAGFLPPEIAALSLLMAAAVATGVRAGAVFFPSLAGLIFGLGMILSRQSLALPLALAAAVAALPWLLTLLFPRMLVVTHRAKRISRERATAADKLK